MNSEEEKEVERKAYLYLKEKVKKPSEREVYLAYAFVRGKAYVELEKTILEDTFPEVGRNTFYNNLAYGVMRYVERAYNITESAEYMQKYKQVKSWMMEKFSQKDVEVAA